MSASAAKGTLKCTHHPRYLAKRKPTARCQACKLIFHIAQGMWNLISPGDGSGIYLDKEKK